MDRQIAIRRPLVASVLRREMPQIIHAKIGHVRLLADALRSSMKTHSTERARQLPSKSGAREFLTRSSGEFS